eukprot:jgi/Chrzof1/3182/Cz12g14260.t1
MCPRAQYYLDQHGLYVYIKDATSLMVSNPDLDPVKFMADYLTAVVGGQHVIGRHYGFVSATAYNRQIFLGCFRKAVAHLASSATHLTQGDCHSLLQLLCADMPVGAVKNAWSSAVALQAGANYQQGGETSDCTVSIDVFVHCLEVTWMYEQYLMMLRRQAFDAHKTCKHRYT